MQPTTVIASLVGAAVVLTWRIRETQRPVTTAKLLIPPLGMSTGFLMFAVSNLRVSLPWGVFAVPELRVPLLWGIAAFAAGAIFFSYPLVHTSHLERQGDAIMLRRSKVFLWILLALVAVRLALRSYVEIYVSTAQTGSLFFLLAFGMLLPWRVTMYLRYRRLMDPDGGPRATGTG